MTRASALSIPEPSEFAARGSITYWDLGTGPSVLLLHTFPDHAISLFPLAERLVERGYRVIVPVLPGYRPSQRLDSGDYRSRAVAGDFDALLAGLGVESGAVVGHGWGAEIGYQLGAHYSDRVTRLVAIGAPHAAGFAERHRSLVEIASAGYAYFLAYNPNAPAIASKREWLTALVAMASPGLRHPYWEEVLDLIAQPSEIETAGRYYRLSMEDDEELAPVLVPTTVIHGGQSRAVRPSLFHGLEDWFPAGLNRILLADLGQWPHLEDPDRALDLIVSALSFQADAV